MQFKFLIKLKRSTLLLILLPFLWGCAESPQAPPASDPNETYVSGTIVADTVWNKDGSPYIVTEDVIVPREVTLTIKPGTEVRFDGGDGLIVQGALNATGTPKDPILFTSHQSTPKIGSWKGIAFENTEGKNILQYARVEYADVGITCSLSSSQIVDSWIMNNQTGVKLNVSSANIVYNSIQNNITGINALSSLSSSAPVNISNNIIAHNEKGIAATDLFSINRNHIIDNFEYGIFVNGRCRVYAQGQLHCKNIDARENWWGNTDAEEIANQIFDHEDQPHLHRIVYIPYATSEFPDAGPRL